MNKKYLLIASIFIAGFSYDSFAGHFDHFDHDEDHNDTHASECQACEENVEIQLSKTKTKQNYLKNQPTTDLISRFVSYETKSNQSRAPPSN